MASVLISYGSVAAARKKLYEALKYSGLVTSDMSFSQMLDALEAYFPDVFNATYVANGSSTTVQKKVGENLLNRTASRDGYTFQGWSNSASSTSVLSSYTMPANNVSLYAVWNHAHISSCYTEVGGAENYWKGDGSDNISNCGTCGQSYQLHYYRCKICGADCGTARTSNCTCGAYPEYSNVNNNHHPRQNVITCGKTEGLSVY